MVKLYLLGGENVSKRDAKEVNALAFQDAGGSPAVLVFPWARPSFDVRYSRRKRVAAYFKSLGAVSVEFSEFCDPHCDLVSKVVGADLVYLTGGQVSTLLSRLRKSGIDKLVQNYGGVVVGRSAGAVIFGKNCLVTNRYSRRLRLVKGLGLIDFSIKAHYEPSKDNLLRKLSKKEKIYAIPKGAAVICDGANLSFVGRVFLFENGQKNCVN